MIIVGKFKLAFIYKLIFCITLGAFITPVFAQDDTQYKTYIDEKNSYSIDYPSHWQILNSQYSDGGTHFVDNRDDQPVAVVNVNKVKSSQRVSDMAASTENYITSQVGVSGFRVISEDKISIAGLQGIVKLVQYTLNGNQSTVKSAYLSHEDNVITVSMASTMQVIEELIPLYDHMLESITFL